MKQINQLSRTLKTFRSFATNFKHQATTLNKRIDYITLKQVCIPVGCVPPACWRIRGGGLHPGGSASRGFCLGGSASGGSASRRFCIQGGLHPGGLPRGVCPGDLHPGALLRGVCLGESAWGVCIQGGLPNAFQVCLQGDWGDLLLPSLCGQND